MNVKSGTLTCCLSRSIGQSVCACVIHSASCSLSLVPRLFEGREEIHTGEGNSFSFVTQTVDGSHLATCSDHGHHNDLAICSLHLQN